VMRIPALPLTVSTTTRSAVIEQLRELLLGQAPPPGHAACPSGKLEHRIDVPADGGRRR
jgi:hypothetical protein